MSVLIFAASQREGSYNRRLAKIAAVEFEACGQEVEWLEYRGLNVPLFDDGNYTLNTLPAAAVGFVHLLEASRAVVIATPEYNWSIPGHLKNLIDWTSCLRPYPFADKPILLLSASPSRRGGLAGLIQTQIPLTAQGARVFPHFFALAQAQEALAAGDRLSDPLLDAELRELISRFILSL